MRTVLTLAVALLVAEIGWAAETDVENPAYRELPLQRGGPIYGGKQHQPTQAEIDERVQTKGRDAAERDRQSQDLYQRVLKQSQQATPRSIDPSQ
jgi:hypothetical protein